jgi:hypothetical protein
MNNNYEEDLNFVYATLEKSGMFKNLKTGEPIDIKSAVIVVAEASGKLLSSYLLGDIYNVKALTLTIGAALKYIHSKIEG